MRASRIIGFALIVTSLILLFFNILSGLNLSANLNSAAAEGHLMRALSLLGCVIVGNVFLFQEGQKSLENFHLDSSKPPPKNFDETKSSAFISSFAAILVSLISVITGTISQSGQFPIVHGILGFSLGVILILELIFWGGYFSKLS